MRKSKLKNRKPTYQPANLRPHKHFIDVENKKRANSILYWSGMLLLTMLNFLAALILIPFLLSAELVPVILILVMLGLFFGYVFHLLINQLEHIEHEHRLFAIIFIPMVALIGVLSVITALTSLAAVIGLPPPPNPFLAGGIYLAAFVLPTIVSYIVDSEKTITPASERG